MIASVPLHWRRLASRSFDQAAWVALALSHWVGGPWKPALLRGPKHPGGQAGLSCSAPARLVAGAFEVAAGKRLEGVGVLLVDDVITTGATVEACARALKKAEAGPVHFAGLARVVKPTDVSI